MRKSDNQFTAPTKLSDGSRGDLRTHCKTFKMTAVDENDMIFLSHLYRTIWVKGGTITINENSGTKETYRF